VAEECLITIEAEECLITIEAMEWNLVAGPKDSLIFNFEDLETKLKKKFVNMKYLKAAGL
jgi:hypothetical protein